MPTDDRYPQRKSPRLRQFDYSSRNHYFITICTKDKECLFGTPTALSAHGLTAREILETVPAHHPGAVVEQFVVMPNHIHFILSEWGRRFPA